MDTRMKKCLALDLGDAWVGIAISDALGIVARPYTTVASKEIVHALHTLVAKEAIGVVVVGYPKTMKGLESAQTKKVIQQKESLEQTFPNIVWILWDERLSSKRADAVRIAHGKQQKSKEEKLLGHARAAAFILDSYLTSRAVAQEIEEG